MAIHGGRSFKAGRLCRSRPVPAVLLVIAVLVGIAGCATAEQGQGWRCGVQPGQEACPAASPSATTNDAVSFSVVGDSITAGLAPLVGDEVPGSTSWVPSALGDPLLFTGGWAVPGSTTDAMLAGVQQAAPDVVVVLGGTNDLTFGIPRERTKQNIEDIVDRVGAAAAVLSAVPPKDDQPAAVGSLNADLAQLASTNGWEFVDPWGAASDAGRYRPGTSPDGIHPEPDAAAVAGGLIRRAVLAAAQD